jgi:hypothetical protein
MTRYHGVFAPNSHRRAQVMPGQRGRRRMDEETDRTAAAGHAAMTWAHRLKRVFPIDIETCHHCGGAVKIIVRIEDPAVIETILTHRNKKATGTEPTRLPESRTPPQAVLLDGP